jgi:hypothetical protein
MSTSLFSLLPDAAIKRSHQVIAAVTHVHYICEPGVCQERVVNSVDVIIPVSEPAAESLRDPAERKRLGALISVALTSGANAEVLASAIQTAAMDGSSRQMVMRTAFSDIRSAATTAGLTPEEVDEELAAWKQVRQVRSAKPAP